MVMGRMSADISLVDDSVDDVEPTVTVLSDYWSAEKIIVVHDGAEADDYLHGRGKYAASTRTVPRETRP